MKVVINSCYGGANIAYDEDRTDSGLVDRTERGEDNSEFSRHIVVDIPDGAYFVIGEYDGVETLH